MTQTTNSGVARGCRAPAPRSLDIVPTQATSEILAPLALSMQRHADAEGVERYEVPEWIHLVPGGETVEGRDGRAFHVEDPQAIIEASDLPMQLDVDHRSVGFFESDTRAFGWIDRIEHVPEDEEGGRAAGFWGHVETWTDEGRELVASRAFRGISPVIQIQRRFDEDGEELEPALTAFINAALTNRPNLRMTLLNSQEPNRPKEAAMAKDKDELAQTSAELAEAKAEVETLRRAQAAELKKMQAELAEMKAEKARIEAERFAMEVEAVLDEHCRRGALQPHGRDFFAKAARGETTLADVKAHLEALDAKVSGEPHVKNEGEGADVIELSEFEKRKAAEMGVTEEAYLKAKKAGL